VGRGQVNHINNAKGDNRPENLEWCSGQENIAHAMAMGVHSCLHQGG
jgi:hypothetical protein